MNLRLTLTGIDETAKYVEDTHKLALLAVAKELEWGGAAMVATMREGHPPGGPHPEDGMDSKVRATYGRLVDGPLPKWPLQKYYDRTGQLTRSLGHSVESWNGRTVTLKVFATARHADSVEYGTPRSRPYPFFWPSIYKHMPELETRVKTAVTTAYAARAISPKGQ